MRLRFTSLLCCLIASSACVNGGGGIFIFDGTEVTGAVTWSGTVEVRNSFEVRGTLTIAKCTTVLLPPGGLITVRGNGAIKSEGTADCPVTLRSVKTTPAPGDWSRIDVYAEASNDTRFTHTRILHGDGTTYGVIWVEGSASVGLDNVTFEQSRAASLHLERGARLTAFTGVRFVNTNRVVVRTDGDLVASLNPMTASETPEARVEVTAADITRAATWKNLGVPLELPGFNIFGGVIEVEAGSVLKLGPQAVLSVRDGGGLRLLGTAASPIIIESAKSTPAAGDWRRIDLYATSTTSLFRNVTVRHGGDDLYGVLWAEAGATVNLESTTFSSNSSCDVGGEGTVNNTASTFMRCP